MQLDQRAIDRELRSRDGSVGKVMAGFAGLATRTIHEEMRARAGGEWWPIESSLVQTTLTIQARSTRPHDIYPVRARALVFQVGGQVVFSRHVRHPGSAPPPKLIEDAVKRAGTLYAVLSAVNPLETV
jgi:hypothetical protein